MPDYISLIPDCRAVDYTDANAISGCGHLIAALMQRTPEYSCGSEPTVASTPVVKAAKEWIRLVEDNVGFLPVTKVIEALSDFDLIYRLVYGRPAPRNFLNTNYLRVFDARIHGNYRIEESWLVRVISDGLNCRDKIYLDQPLKWRSLTLDAWIDEIQNNGRFVNVNADEALRRVSQIVYTDLFAFCGSRQEAFKRQLVQTYLPYTEKIAEMNSITQKSLLMLVRSICGKYLDSDTAWELETEIMTPLSTSPSLTPHDRHAYRLDCEFRKMIEVA